MNDLPSDACLILLQYAGVRANTLGLDPSRWAEFSDRALTHWRLGLSHEAALVEAAKEI